MTTIAKAKKNNSLTFLSKEGGARQSARAGMGHVKKGANGVARIATTKNPSKLTLSKTWELRLYVAGQTSKSITAFANLKKICEEHIPGKYHIEVVDLLKNPTLAKGDQILAIPTLVRKLPEPIRKILGDLSDTERVLVGLDLRQMGEQAA